MRFRHISFLRSFFHGLYRMWHEISAAFLILFLMVLLACGGVYYFEREAQPETFSSYWVTLYWGIMTTTTVGYGDLAPITWQGRLIASVFALVGVGFLLLLVSTFAAAYVLEASRGEVPPVCPHCGRPIERDDAKDNVLQL